MDGDTQTGFCLRCRYDLRSCLDLVCSECGRAFDPADPTTFYRPGTQRSWRLRAGPPSLWHLLAVPVFVIGYPLAASLPGGSPASVAFWALGLWMTHDVIERMLALRSDRSRALRDRSPQSQRSVLRWLIVPTCFAIAASVWLTSWPLRLRFACSRDDLESLVASTRQTGRFWPVITKVPSGGAGLFPVDFVCNYGRDGVYIQTGYTLGDSVGLDHCCSVEGCRFGQRRIAGQWFVDER